MSARYVVERLLDKVTWQFERVWEGDDLDEAIKVVHESDDICRAVDMQAVSPEIVDEV